MYIRTVVQREIEKNRITLTINFQKYRQVFLLIG